MITRRNLIGAGVIALSGIGVAIDPRAAARAAGFDPDEFVCYGPPLWAGDGDPVDRECPAWVLFDPAKKARLP